MWTLVTFVAAAALVQDPPELPAEAFACVGRWDVTVDYGSRKGYAWLEIEPSGRILVGRYVGHGGSARPIAQVHWDKGSIRFDLPRQWERNDLKFQIKLDGEKLAGTIAGLEQGTMPFVAVRAPELKRAQEPSWGEPIELFNGKNLEGWRTFGRRRSQWSVKDGLMSNAAGGANIATNASFADFKLHAEFRYPEGSNSGIYLRGRYELQIQDDFGKEPNRHAAGSLYGFISPLSNAAKKAGEWQTMEITLVGRLLTVLYNGERIIERQIIPGITGGAIDCHEGELGPIYIQGDHGPIEFRKLTLTPGS